MSFVTFIQGGLGNTRKCLSPISVITIIKLLTSGCLLLSPRFGIKNDFSLDFNDFINDNFSIWHHFQIEKNYIDVKMIQMTSLPKLSKWSCTWSIKRTICLGISLWKLVQSPDQQFWLTHCLLDVVTVIRPVSNVMSHSQNWRYGL